MRILSPSVIKAFKNKILNIHPAILPSFKGVNSINRAFNRGCKLIGVTVHFVTEDVDAGPIILQDCIKVTKTMTLAQAEKLIHKLEHELYPKAVKLFVDKKIKVTQRKVKDV